jgi:hypothetical protein
MAKKRGGCNGGGQPIDRPASGQVINRRTSTEPMAVKPIPPIVDDKKKRKE